MASNRIAIPLKCEVTTGPSFDVFRKVTRAMFDLKAQRAGASAVARGESPETPASGQLIIRLLGDFAAEADGRKISLATRKAKALTAYLALSDNVQDTRERLVGLLW